MTNSSSSIKSKPPKNEGLIISNIESRFSKIATIMILPCIWRLLLVFFRPNLTPTTSKTKINICNNRFRLEIVGAAMVIDIKFTRK
jgi:hypothetical protein